jgi:uncharacterized protein (DUF2384 family)
MKPAIAPDRGGQSRILGTALARIAENWRLTNEQLGAVLGLSTATASRLRSGAFRVEPDSKPFELGQYLLRLFRGLDALMGSDDEAAISWLKAPNLDLAGRPLDLIRTVKGLSEVTHYVDDFRARV